ncbi:MAG: hypothetical protein ACI8W3_000907 [Myxococcota bacterium]|jgi:hypothetical protein
MMKASQDPIQIGWTEFVDLPDWNIRKLLAKVDTGARTSALHVENIEELPRDFVRFDVVLHREKRDRRIHVKAKIVRRGKVRSSTGVLTSRLFVETDLTIGPITKRIEVSLVDREKMIHRMLLGREALKGPILIDVDRRMVLSAKPKKKRKATTRK